MSDIGIRMQDPSVGYPVAWRTRWGAIWAGVFTFAAVWTVFEALGMAIFWSANTPAAAGAGTSVGLQVWTVVLTIIAMYVAGLETGRLASVANRHEGLIHGMVMFGLSVVSAVIVSSVANGFFAGPAATRAAYGFGRYGVSLVGTQWATFVGLFLGWLAAMGGASTGSARGTAEVKQPIQMRPAA